MVKSCWPVIIFPVVFIVVIFAPETILVEFDGPITKTTYALFFDVVPPASASKILLVDVPVKFSQPVPAIYCLILGAAPPAVKPFAPLGANNKTPVELLVCHAEFKVNDTPFPLKGAVNKRHALRAGM